MTIEEVESNAKRAVDSTLLHSPPRSDQDQRSSPPSDNDKIDLGERIMDTLVANFVEPRATPPTTDMIAPSAGPEVEVVQSARGCYGVGAADQNKKRKLNHHHHYHYDANLSHHDASDQLPPESPNELPHTDANDNIGFPHAVSSYNDSYGGLCMRCGSAPSGASYPATNIISSASLQDVIQGSSKEVHGIMDWLLHDIMDKYGLTLQPKCYCGKCECKSTEERISTIHDLKESFMRAFKMILESASTPDMGVGSDNPNHISFDVMDDGVDATDVEPSVGDTNDKIANNVGMASEDNESGAGASSVASAPTTATLCNALTMDAEPCRGDSNDDIIANDVGMASDDDESGASSVPTLSTTTTDPNSFSPSAKESLEVSVQPSEDSSSIIDSVVIRVEDSVSLQPSEESSSVSNMTRLSDETPINKLRKKVPEGGIGSYDSTQPYDQPKIAAEINILNSAPSKSVTKLLKQLWYEGYDSVIQCTKNIATINEEGKRTLLEMLTGMRNNVGLGDVGALGSLFPEDAEIQAKLTEHNAAAKTKAFNTKRNIQALAASRLNVQAMSVFLGSSDEELLKSIFDRNAKSFAGNTRNEKNKASNDEAEEAKKRRKIAEDELAMAVKTGDVDRIASLRLILSNAEASEKTSVAKSCKGKANARYKASKDKAEEAKKRRNIAEDELAAAVKTGDVDRIASLRLILSNAEASEKTAYAKSYKGKENARYKASNDEAEEAKRQVGRVEDELAAAKKEGDADRIASLRLILSDAEMKAKTAYAKSNNGKQNARRSVIKYGDLVSFDRRTLFTGLDKAIAKQEESMNPPQRVFEIQRILQQGVAKGTSSQAILAKIKDSRVKE
eukprot:scaffold3592_cov139-Skeletonema_marinoi.AAC.10